MFGVGGESFMAQIERFSAGRKGSRRVVGYLRSHVDGFDEQREC